MVFSMSDLIRIISGNSNPQLAQDISDYLDIPLVDAEVQNFSDGETKIEIRGNVRGEDVFIIQSTSRPANNTVMELLILIDAVRRSSARRITAVIPYFGYARQDAKPAPRTPITAKLVANLLERAGADRVLTMDLHARQTQGFFDVPCDNLYALPVFVRDIKGRFNKKMKNGEELMIISPDVGGVVRARALAKKLDCDLAIIDKRRERANVSEVMNIIGDVENRHCIIYDDMADTAGTLVNGAEALIRAGAKTAHAYVTHGVLSGPANKRLTESTALKSLTITDTICYPYGDEVACNNVRKVSVAPLLAKAIRRTADEKSISELFK